MHITSRYVHVSTSVAKNITNQVGIYHKLVAFLAVTSIKISWLCVIFTSVANAITNQAGIYHNLVAFLAISSIKIALL